MPARLAGMPGSQGRAQRACSGAGGPVARGPAAPRNAPTHRRPRASIHPQRCPYRARIRRTRSGVGGCVDR
jgi:hypothetical protein